MLARADIAWLVSRLERYGMVPSQADLEKFVEKVGNLTADLGIPDGDARVSAFRMFFVGGPR